MRYRVTVRGRDVELRGLVDGAALVALTRAVGAEMPDAMVVASALPEVEGPLATAWASVYQDERMEDFA
jgi:hypothetical protein